MAPNKRSSSPTQPPSWIQDLLSDFQRLRQDFFKQESSIREIRSIVLENQDFLRSKLRTTPPAVVRSSSDHFNYGPVRPSVSKAMLNNAVRDSAFPIPRATRPNSEAIHKICWYHRQFGSTSANCIQPCAFVAPVLPTKKVKPAVPPVDNSIKAATISLTATITSIAVRPPPPDDRNQLESNRDDWNALVQAEKPHPALSDSSSSSDSSSDESLNEEHIKKP